MSNFDSALLFKCIVERGSLAKAAQYYGISPSAVSKRLHKLETSLGVQLINRTTRSLVLTDAGSFFYDRITRIQYDWQATTEETGNLGKQVKGTLRIATLQPIAGRFLMPVLALIQQQHPALTLEIVYRQMENLPCLEADISISRELEYYDSRTMMVKTFFHHHNRLFASPNYLKNAPPIHSIHDLENHRCMIYQDNRTQQWEFQSGTTKLQKVTIANNAEIMIAGAKRGMGLVYLPEVILEEELNLGTLACVLPEEKSQIYKTNIYYLKADFVPEKVRLLINVLSSYYKEKSELQT